MAFDPLGYPSCNQGLNNQKLALLGLLLLARQAGRPVALPHLMNFDPGSGATGQHVHFQELFSLEALMALAREWDVPIVVDRYVKTVDQHAAFAVGRAAAKSDRETFLGAIVPNSRLSEIVDGARASMRRYASLQLRIERDWIGYAAKKLATVPGEDNLLDYRAILRKMVALHWSDPVFVTCDEGSLSVSRSEIAAHADTIGLRLVWKSDILGAPLSLLESTEFDFQMARYAEIAVGTSRSTFANLLATVRTGATYIYNTAGDLPARRTDFGMKDSAVAATA